MIRALVLGCGEIGKEAVADLFRYGDFDEIVVGTRHPEEVHEFLQSLPGSGAQLTALRVDAADAVGLRRSMQGASVVVNCIGPNYRYEIPIALAAIEAGVGLVDLNDEYETTLEMFELDGEAAKAGIAVILGLGGSPGVNNVLVRAAANQLDSVDEIHTAWTMSAADPGGPALCAHLLHSLSNRALTVADGRLVEARSFVDGRERVEFPAPVGPLDVYHVGHPEPLMLFRSFPEARCIDDKATFNPSGINTLIRDLGERVRRGRDSSGGGPPETVESAVALLREQCQRFADVPPEAALVVRVQGRRKGKAVRVFFSSCCRLAPATGIPASIGAIMLSQGRIRARGVLSPEQCIEADDFLYEILTRRDVAKLNGWVED